MENKLEILSDQIAGLEKARKSENEKRDLFLKAQGMEIEAEKMAGKLAKLKESLEQKKENIKKFRLEKANALNATCESLSNKISEALPEGTALISISEDLGVEIGWDDRPYDGLSGGEKVIFDGALAHAFKADLLIYEAAEVDPQNLEMMLERLLKLDQQVIVNTWYCPAVIPEGWFVVDLEGNKNGKADSDHNA